MPAALGPDVDVDVDGDGDGDGATVTGVAAEHDRRRRTKWFAGLLSSRCGASAGFAPSRIHQLLCSICPCHRRPG
jgi:hypothetical protein